MQNDNGRSFRLRPIGLLTCCGARVALQRCPILRAGELHYQNQQVDDNVYTKFLTPPLSLSVGRLTGRTQLKTAVNHEKLT